MRYLFLDISIYEDKEDFPDCPRELLLPEYNIVTLPPTPPPTGAPGPTGPKGRSGPRGAQGLPGLTGERGLPGIDGDDGDTGLGGEQGYTGEQGPTGKEGVSGPTGRQGAKGSQGESGDRGERGPTGQAGEVVYVTSPPKAGNALASSQEEKFEFLSTWYIKVAIGIWLAVLTIVILIVLILLCKLRRQPSPMLHRQLSSSQFSSANDINKSSWLETLREDTETNYSIETISDPASPSTSRGGLMSTPLRIPSALSSSHIDVSAIDGSPMSTYKHPLYKS